MIASAAVYEIDSPEGLVHLSVNVGDKVSYSVDIEGRPVIEEAVIAMDFGNGTKMPKVKKSKKTNIKEVIQPQVPMKFSSIDNKYNALTLTMADNYAIEFRVMDNGVAHRFVTTMPDSVNVVEETFELKVPESTIMHMQPTGSFKTSFENPYIHKLVSAWNENDDMSTNPVLIQNENDMALISESDLRDYPAFFMNGSGDGKFHAVFPKVPTKFGPDGDRSVKILEEAPYIARTVGKRSFPWRYVAVGNLGDIMTQTLEVQLAEKPSGDFSWVEPGQASWEWWNGATPYGDDVNFESGYNLDTYKYFIDFASKYGIKYIIMDEGWANSTLDPFTPNPNVDLHEVIRYGKEKGVGVFVWLTWLCVENNFDLFKTLADWGVKGLKIDFMDRGDQWMVNFYERAIKEAAANGLLVDFHGAFTPSGLEVTYPNLINYEGVRGMEYMGGCHPSNSIYYPFIRNAVGPMDYTPGAMFSMQPERYRAERPNAASIGTRAYQMALFTIFEGGLQMLADNPTLYYRNPDCTEFITSVPTTWDETVPVITELGKTVAVAKRKGDTWYLAAITASDEKWNPYTVSLDFLDDGIYEITSFSDGINAPHQAMDYRKNTGEVSKTDTLDFTLARNGGYTAILKKKV